MVGPPAKEFIPGGSISGPCTTFPAPGLRTPQRVITGHNEKGEAVFLQVNKTLPLPYYLKIFVSK